MLSTAFLLFSLSITPGNAFAGAPKAEAEVSASSGPLRLTFRVHHTRIKLGGSSTNHDGIFFQVELQNIGQQAITITDRLFKDGQGLLTNEAYEMYTFFELRDSSGRIVKPTNQQSLCVELHAMNFKITDVDSETQDKIDRWRKQGVTREEIGARLEPEIYIEKMVAKRTKQWKVAGVSRQELKRRELVLRKELHDKYQEYFPETWSGNDFTLQPGESIVTPAWAVTDDCDPGEVSDLAPDPHRPFLEAEDYPFWLFRETRPPGRYTLRAVFDNRLKVSADELIELRRKGLDDLYVPTPDRVLIRTEPIFLEVLPE